MDTEQMELHEGPAKRGLGYWIGVGVLLTGPAVSYVIFEGITGSLTAIHGKYLIINLVFYYTLYLLAAGITNSTRIAYPLLNTVLTILALAEYFVLQFRGRPIMVWDVMAFKTALTVSGSYTYTFTPQLWMWMFFSLEASVLAVIFPFKQKSKKRWLAGAAASAVLFFGWQSVFQSVLVPKYNIDVSMWDPAETYGYTGYMLCTMRSLEYLLIDPPEGYSAKLVKELGEELEQKKGEARLWETGNDTVPTNIICIMNESYSDLRTIADFQTDVPFMENYEAISDRAVKGNLYMPVWGSMTPNSEYEFLTGNAIAFSPSGSVPYQTYMQSPVFGLPRILKSQGYRTVAMHPYVAENWNRVTAYDAMGFDAFYAEADFEGEPLLRGYISDAGNFHQIMKLTEEKEPGEPLFIFNVTMQNHGGYEDASYESTVHLTDLPGYPLTEQYLSLMKATDEALKGLLDYYETVDEPTMIVMFGDHQPSVEQSFYETLYGQPLNELKTEDFLRRYATPFLVWTNYETPYQEIDKISAQYLANIVLERANLETTDYQIFLDEMYQAAPVVHILGYYNSDGVWESWTNWKDKKEYPILHQFDMLQYNNIFGKKSRIDSIFSLPDGNDIEK